MTLTSELETWSKITAHPLPKGTLCVKYESDRTKGKEDMSRTGTLGRTDGMTDRLITIGQPQSKALIII